MRKVLNKIIPQVDKLKHFYLWSIFLALSLTIMPDIYAYALCMFTAWGVEEYQRITKTGVYELKDMFFGGVLPVALHLITTI